MINAFDKSDQSIVMHALKDLSLCSGVTPMGLCWVNLEGIQAIYFLSFTKGTHSTLDLSKELRHCFNAPSTTSRLSICLWARLDRSNTHHAVTLLKEWVCSCIGQIAYLWGVACASTEPAYLLKILKMLHSGYKFGPQIWEIRLITVCFEVSDLRYLFQSLLFRSLPLPPLPLCCFISSCLPTSSFLPSMCCLRGQIILPKDGRSNHVTWQEIMNR